MAFNYFKTVENKYKSRISPNKPIIIRLDGKKITKNKEINMLNEEEGAFAYALQKASSHISRKFNCLVLTSSDEINLIITEPSRLSRLYDSFECQKVSSLISQDIGYVFNKYYEGDIILFDARTFNIPAHKISSYVSYRLQSARNVQTMYFAKRLLSPRERCGKKMNELEEMLDSFSSEFKDRNDYKKHGCCFFRSQRIDSQLILDNLSSIDFYAFSTEGLSFSTHKKTVLIEDDTLNDSVDDLFD